MKKFIVLMVIVALAVCSIAALTGCQSADYTVGIVQLDTHPALDASNKGFQDRLTELMTAEGKTVKFQVNNAQGDVSNATTAAQTLVTKRVDLIFAIATPTAQAAQSTTKDIPIVFTAVTSAKEAELENIANITGTTDLNDVKKQVELMFMLRPNATKFGIMYTTSEDNSTLQKNMAVAEMKEKGMSESNIIVKGISDINDVASTFESFKNEGVECIYIPTDNKLANGAATVHSVNKDSGANIPIVCGETGMNDICGVATYGVDYYTIGVKAAEMAFEIIVNGKKPSEIPVVDPVSSDDDFSYNEEVANAIGFTIPDAVKNIGKAA